MPTALTARLVLPISGERIDEGVVVIDDGRIVRVGSGIPPDADVVDLNKKNDVTSGGVAILPGLVNVHTHLEFSDLELPLGEAGAPFTDWIRAVIAHLRESDPLDAPPHSRETVLRGLTESVSAGVTALGEIAQLDWPLEVLDEDDRRPGRHVPDVTVFYELLGLTDERAAALTAELNRVARRIQSSSRKWRLGVSPHAPYSTHWKLIEAACRFSRERRAPLAMHVAESLPELELLQTHGGPFRALLEEHQVWNAGGIPRGSRPLDYLQRLSTTHRALVIHGNYLDDEEIDFLAASADRMSVVYCPRTHAYFEHQPYPLNKMLAAGVNVVLGTDSRASNPDLSLLAEMRFVAAAHPHVSPTDILRLGTYRGARALGIEHQTGTLEAGKRADFTVIALPEQDTRDPYESLLHGDLPVVATYIGGETV